MLLIPRDLSLLNNQRVKALSDLFVGTNNQKTGRLLRDCKLQNIYLSLFLFPDDVKCQTTLYYLAFMQEIYAVFKCYSKTFILITQRKRGIFTRRMRDHQLPSSFFSPPPVPAPPLFLWDSGSLDFSAESKSHTT